MVKRRNHLSSVVVVAIVGVKEEDLTIKMKIKKKKDIYYIRSILQQQSEDRRNGDECDRGDGFDDDLYFVDCDCAYRCMDFGPAPCCFRPTNRLT